MKKIINLLIVFAFFANSIIAQSDDCITATVLPVTANCSSPMSGSTAGATQSIAGCVGTADDDVWYQFVATSAAHEINVVGSASFDAVVQVFSGSCSTIATLYCKDATGTGGTETIFASGLTPGNTYLVRVYHYFAGSGSSNFSICITTPPPAPSNDACANATVIGVNNSCVYTAGTTVSATQSQIGCSGTADDDVWFRFIATNSVQTITVDPSSSMDAVVQLFSGTCGTMTSLNCEDNGLTNGTETINAIGLIPGNTYFVRVYNYYGSTGGDNFNICVSGTPTATPTNDDPCSAIALPPVTSACTYLNFTTTGSTASTGAPTPSACAGGSGAAIGGFSASSHDVWFTVTVPASGSLYITPQPNFGINDAVMVLYSGSCGSLTQISCSDDHNYPGGSNDLKPYIAETGLTPGAVLYVRYFGWGTSSGDFGICVTSPTNDNCSSALYICDINGYGASTSAAYTPDRPCNMFGNNETSAGVNQPNGTNTGGVFGQGGSWGTGSPFIDVNIENNSWIEFTAGGTTAVLTVSIFDCWVGNYPSGGIQMQIFSGTGCCNFVPVSNFEENSTGFTITANSLTVGQNYYLMIDGYAGDICNYTINATSGVSFPNIIASSDPICTGASTTLTVPASATSYTWYPGGATTPSITVSPSATTTYTCIVEGVCGYKQTLTKTITVNQLPNVTSSATATVCSGLSVNHLFVADLSSTYSWIANDNPNTTGESTTMQSGNTINDVIINTTTIDQIVNYTVTPTSSFGCVGPPTTIAVTVYPLPTMTSVASQIICSGDAVNIPLTSNSSATYSWIAADNLNTTGESTTAQNTNTINDVITNTSSITRYVNYLVTPTSTTNSCVGASQAVQIAVRPEVNANAGSDLTLDCNTTSGSFTATGGGTYSWSTPSGTIAGATVALTDASSPGNYTVTVTSLGCTDTDVAVLTLDLATPNADAGNDVTYTCAATNVQLDGTGSNGNGITYSWTGPGVQFNGNTATPTVNQPGSYLLIVQAVNGCVDSSNVQVVPDVNAPVADAGLSVTIDCITTVVSLDGSGSDSGSNITYQWNTPDGNVISGGNSNTATVNSGGTYFLIVNNTTNGCTNTASVQVDMDTLSPNVVVNPVSVLNCFDLTPILDGSQSTGFNETYSWTTLNGDIINGANTNSIEISQGGNYVLTVTNSNGCFASGTVSVTMDTLTPNAAFTADTQFGPPPLDVQFTNGSTGGSISYLWDFDNGVTDTILNPSMTFEDVLDYSVVLTVVDTNGCSDTATIVITVDGDVIVNIPNVFTPNSDGSNDVFYIDVTNGKDVKAYIYNRWGQIMYQWDGTEGGWDGRTSAGLEASEATYLYLIRVIDLKDEEHFFEGFFNLRR